MKSNLPDLPDLTNLDPAVASVLRTGQTSAADRSLPKKDQARKARERQKAAARNRITIDIEHGLQMDLIKLAFKYDVPVSNLINFAAMLMCIDIQDNGLDLNEYLRPTNSRNGKSTLCLYRDTPILKPPKV
jgi:hypothetical protein